MNMRWLDINNLETRWEKATNELISELKVKGINFEKLSCLELFGRDGTWHVSIFDKIVKSLEIWEISKECKFDLEKNFPDSTIRIVDSVKTIKNGSDLPKIDLLLIDNPTNVYKNSKGEKYCEHFDVIKEIHKFCKKEILVIFNVNRAPFDYDKYPEWKKFRDSFYKNSKTNELSIDFLHKFYEELFKKIGLETIFKINVTRVFYNNIDMTHYFAYYLRLK